jgi:hypothetical protein
MQPGEESFYAPTPAVATEGTTILRYPVAIAAMRSYQFNPVGLQQIVVQGVAIVCTAADEPGNGLTLVYLSELVSAEKHVRTRQA